MTNQPPLFHELEFTKENVLIWAEEGVLDCPVVQADGQDHANTVQLILQSVLINHYAQEWASLDKGELIQELLAHVVEGVGKPLAEMTTEELLAEVMEVCEVAYEFETMDDFVRCFCEED
jgi:hypothetical protein